MHGNPPQRACLENPHGQRSLAGYSPQGRKEWDTTERLSTHTHSFSHLTLFVASETEACGDFCGCKLCSQYYFYSTSDARSLKKHQETQYKRLLKVIQNATNRIST